MARKTLDSATKNGETDVASNGSGSELQNRPTTAPKKGRSKSATKPTQMLHQAEKDGSSFRTPQKSSVTVSPGRSASTRERKKSMKAKESEESLETNEEVMWVSFPRFEMPPDTEPETAEEASPERNGVDPSPSQKQTRRRKKKKKPLTLATAQRKKAAKSAAKRLAQGKNATPSSVSKPKRLSKKAKPVAEKQPTQSPLPTSTAHQPTVPEPQPSTSTGAADHSGDSGLQINRLKVLKLGGDMEDAIQIIISYLGGRKELTVEEELKRREHEQSVEEGKLKDAKEALVKLGLKLQTYSNKLTIDQDDAEADGHRDEAMKEEVNRVNAGIDVLLAVGQKIESEKERLQASRLELAMQRVDFEKQRCAASKAQ